MQQNENFAKQAEQAEAERPEVVAYFDRNYPSTGDAFIWSNYEGSPYEPVMTVAQHERIVGQLHDALDESDGDRWRLRYERDAALARVAELERKLRNEENAHTTTIEQRDNAEHWADQLANAIAERFGVDIGEHSNLNCPWNEALVWMQQPPAQAQHLHDLDKQCRDDVARALGLRPSQERGFAWSYLLASIKSCVKASEDTAQAQHSVPAYVSYTTRPAESLAGIALRQLKDESRWVEIRDINAHTFPDMQSHSYYPAGTVIKLPAAAPGKEVPQAWLDVQAERRRQVEVEGYHGFRDNHYISYELSKAARAYIEVSWHALSGGLPCKKPESWPWMAGFKWSDGRTMLVKACALALAEIERLDRAAHGKEVGHE